MKNFIIALLLLSTPFAGNCQIKEAKKPYKIGKRYFKKQEYEKAISYFNESIKLQPFDEVYYDRALAHFELHHLKEYCLDLEFASYRDHKIAQKLLAKNCYESDTIYLDKNNQSGDSTGFDVMKINRFSKLLNKMVYEERDSSNKIILSYKIVDQDTIYVVFPGTMPEFPGGPDSLNSYLNKSIRYPLNAWQNGTLGTVAVVVDIDPMGNLKNEKIVVSSGESCDELVMRQVKAMPPWIPGIYKDRKVAVQNFILINYNLPPR